MRIIIGILIAIAVLAVMPAGVQAQSDDGLVAEWHFDEGAGSVLKDSSGNGNDGVIYEATWVEGKYGKALSFDGVDDYIVVPNNIDLSGDYTIGAWINPTIGKGHIIAVKRTDSDYGVPLFLAIDNRGGSSPYTTPTGFSSLSNALLFTLGRGDGVVAVAVNNAIVSDQFQHIVAVVDGTIMKLYINGELKATKTFTGIRQTNTASLFIGAYEHDEAIASGLSFKGPIDEVCIYNCALTDEEIMEHYESGPTSLSLTKTAFPQSIKQGKATTITLTVKNTGSTEITDIEIADTIPLDLTFIDGETSKTYSSLTPKDSRQFQYVLQLNEAGTYNLNPATATYADNKGNYHTVKSKPAAIEVIPSLVETTDQIQRTSGSNAQTASVHLHGEKTDVVKGEDVLLKLAAVNLITKPTMQVQVIITPPSGMSVTSSEFVQSGAGLFTASYEIEPGVGRDIEVKMRSNQVGDFIVNGRIVYYFGDDMDDAEDHTLTLPIKVRAEADAGAERTTDTSGSEGSSTPGFAAVVAFIGLFLAYLRKRI